MMSTPARKACSCGPMPTPPKTAALVSGVWTASSRVCSSIWAASSRVGVMTRARVTPRGLADQPVEDREDEGGGLAAPRHRAGEEVLAGEGGRDRVVLDRGGAREAQLLDAAEEVGVETEGREGHSVFAFRRPAAAQRGEASHGGVAK